MKNIKVEFTSDNVRNLYAARKSVGLSSYKIPF
jgi:hypothetical protein